MTILDRLADHAKERVCEAKKATPLSAIRRQAENLPRGAFAFETALKNPGISFICECKKASPSKGLIAPDFPYARIAMDYEAANTVSIPCLRKDFTVDEYMIYEAKLLGASAVLLICSILSEMQIKEYIAVCDELGLSALVEAHDEREVNTAIRSGARIIGVNNRNLKDFSVDTDNSARLRELIPQDILFVSESGVKGAKDVKRLREIGADAVLIGEALMKAPDKKAKLAELRSML